MLRRTYESLQCGTKRNQESVGSAREFEYLAFPMEVLNQEMTFMYGATKGGHPDIPNTFQNRFSFERVLWQHHTKWFACFPKTGVLAQCLRCLGFVVFLIISTI
ncbi:MAG: hypothetical protein ACJAZW_002899 [Maritalea sp.]|jgi:hypothetical protein